MIQSEKRKYDINISDAEIAKMSRYRFKSLVDKKVNNFVFSKLKSVASKHSKSAKILEEAESVKTFRSRPQQIEFVPGNRKLIEKCAWQTRELQSSQEAPTAHLWSN